ncbi:MAG: LacI family transcriptional regulator [Actinomycetia bacterium]|nr:LacI family transcriptional regulator [Actinomycetes bacterium]
MTTMRDVARVAGVSAKTVSRVFNDDPHVTPETRERVQWAMRRLDYVPNLLARSFRAGTDAAIGLAFPDIGDPFFAAMASSIEESLARAHMAVVVTSLGYDPAREPAALETLLRRQISGLIVASIGPNQAYLQTWLQRTPMVFVDRAPRGLAAVSVVEDDFGGARQAVEHLARHGHRRIALLGGPAYAGTIQRRMDGYSAAVSELGLDSGPELLCTEPQSSQGSVAEFVNLLASEHPPTAAFSMTIIATMALVRALQQADRTDLAVVGFGDVPMAEALSPAITVIDQNPAELGRVAADRLTALMLAASAGPSPTGAPRAKVRRRTVLPVQLIARGSGELPPPSST